MTGVLIGAALLFVGFVFGVAYGPGLHHWFTGG